MQGIKLFNDIPPVKNGVVSASKTPVLIQGRLPVSIETVQTTSMSCFLESDVNKNCDIPEYNVTGSVTSALKSSRIREHNLRDTRHRVYLFKGQP